MKNFNVRNVQSVWQVVALVVLALTFSLVASAQNIVSGELTGVVSDPKGGVVAGAAVTLTNPSTGSSQTTSTNQSGSFRFSLLTPGNYKVSVSSTNYEANSREVVVSVGQVTTANLQLYVKGGKTVVEVTAEAPLLKTEDANISTLFDQKQIDLLPNPGQDLTSFALTAPGVVISTGGGYGNFTAFGLPGTANLFTVNGNDQNDPYLNLNNSGASNLMLGIGEVQEIAVVSNGYSSQYGRQAGAQVNIVTKSGTNKMHGALEWQWNGSVLNANEWFNNNTSTPRPHAVSNSWYANVGGPIVKDKLFWFFDTEGLRYVLPGGGLTIVPTAAFANAVKANIAATSPSQSATYNTIFSLYAGAPGSNRAVPITPAIDSALGCGDYAGGTFGSTTACTAQYQSTVNNLNKEALYVGKVDWKPTQNDSFSFRYKRDRGVQATGTDPINSAFNANSVQPEDDGEVNYTRVINSRMVNQLIASGLYYSAIFGPPNLASTLAVFPTTLSWSGADGTYGMNNLGGSDNAFPQGRNVTQYQIVDDFSWQRGNHGLKFGVNYRRNDITDFASGVNTSGLVTFNSMTDFVNGNTLNGSTVSQNFANNGKEHSIAIYSLGLYIQDEWRATSKLKLTFGLRADKNSNEVCQQNCFSRFATGFAGVDHSATSPYNAAVKTGLHSAFPNLEAVAWQPRVGFAYTFGSKSNTVLRGGFGLFGDLYPGFLASRFETNFPNVSNFVVQGTAAPTSMGAPGSAWSVAAANNSVFNSQFASGGTLASLQAALGASFTLPSISAANTNIKNPKYAEWNIELQHQLNSKTVLSVNYVGNHGYDEFITNNKLNSYCVAPCAAGFGGLPTTAPDTRFRSVSEISNTAHSNYYGIVSSVSRTFTKGFQGTFNYTWSHSKDDVSNGGLLTYSFNSGGDSLRTVLNPANLHSLNYGPSDYDFRHVINAQYVWELPFKSGSYALNSLIGGWSLSQTMHFRTGEPFSVYNSTLGSRVRGGSVTVLADYIGPTSLPTCSGHTCTLTAAMFAASGAQSDFGNLPRNSFRGPRYFNTDMTLAKSFNVFGEGRKLTFALQAFNLFNHPNFVDPVASAKNPAFGQILATASPTTGPYGSFQGAGVSGRVMETMLKFTF